VRTVVAVVGSVVSVALLAGCGDEGAGASDERRCTLIGSESGLSVTVPTEVAPVRGLRLEVCAAGTCETRRVVLHEGTSVAEESCSGDGPDAACAAEVTPDGSQYGFVRLDLVAGPVEVSASRAGPGARVDLAPTAVEAATTYPNGPDCGAGGVQAQVTLTSTGLS
jgi:hypothetical protein